jgi:dipeptidyl aminopeptidase/acylaminoacyl peptidase
MPSSYVVITTRKKALLWISQTLLLLIVLLCAGCQHSQASAGMGLQSEDYSAARKHFQTHLVQHGPGPQQGEPLHPPAGAQQVEYSPTLHLQAWITPSLGNGQTAGAKKPAVLFLHGGFAIGGDDWEMTQPYREAGYMVMMPVLRGENGQSGEYSMFYNEVSDVAAAADYLANLPSVDAKHLYVAGHSVGGTLTLLASMTSSRFRAAASFSGAPDAIAWSKGQQELVVFEPSNVREFQMRSPLAFATSFKCPVRLYYGSEEPLFADASQQTSDRAKKKGLDVEAVRVPGNHFSAVPEEIQQSIRFFQAH